MLLIATILFPMIAGPLASLFPGKTEAGRNLRYAGVMLCTDMLCILASLTVISLFLYRPFCRYICPLGAFYSFFNKVSLYRYGIDDSACNRAKGCSACSRACPMGVDPVKDPNSLECIRCGTCSATCPQKAIHAGVKFKTAEGNAIRTRKSK